jgi:hypothetical protein
MRQSRQVSQEKAQPSRKFGRPSKISRRLIKRIGETIEQGMYVETACVMNGIARKTHYNWLKRGQAAEITAANGPDWLFVEFLHTVQRALAVAAMRDMAIIDQAAQGGYKRVQVREKRCERILRDGCGRPRLDRDGSPMVEVWTTVTKTVTIVPPAWKAAAWRLERRQPHRYGRPLFETNLDVTGTVADEARVGPVLFYRIPPEEVGPAAQ